jgi:hypothetical protein
MNPRTLLLGLAGVLIVFGLFMAIADLLSGPAVVEEVRVAYAARPIPPYTVIVPSMLEEGTLPEEEASDVGAWRFDQVAGKMSTTQIDARSLLTGAEVQPIEVVRKTKDLNLEVLSFAATIDKALAGQIKAGSLVNIYGFKTGSGEEKPAETVLIASNVWVVDVRQGSGELAPRAVESAREELGDQPSPGTVLTVAAEPPVVWRIIDAVGANEYGPWVSLAAAEAPLTGTPRPTSEPTPTGQAVVVGPPGGTGAGIQAPTPLPSPPSTGLGGIRR